MPRPDGLFVPARSACNLYRDIPEGRRIARTLRPKGRICAEDSCSTILSVYNRRKLCGVHEPRLAERVA